ncbi:MAG: flavoprotein [Verrucomicrobiota bacterium]
MNNDLQVELVGDRLEGKTVALCVTGGIAAVESVKLIRALRREGANVHVYATAEALKFIGKAALEWAAARSIVTELSGLAEHICTEDLILVAPATINTVNAISAGLADNVVTTLVASALGRKTPVLIAATGHGSLWGNPIFQRHLVQLPEIAPNVQFIPPKEEEGKAKLPDQPEIVEAAIEVFSDKGSSNS